MAPKKAKPPLAAASGAVDPALVALFASSAGPVHPLKRHSGRVHQDRSNDSISDSPPEPSSDKDEASSATESPEPEANETHRHAGIAAKARSGALDTLDDPSRKRKRKRADENDDLENKYFHRLADDHDWPLKASARGSRDDSVGDSDSAAFIHESLLPSRDTAELDKAARTVFLSNVSTEAITSKKAKKQLLAHLSSVLDKDASSTQKIVSLRFRSVPLATAAMPKRAAVITRAVMEATSKSANAYVVYSDAAAARTAVRKLNGTVVLGRHLRADSVAHPSPVDHKRCVFVGNLGFVDDETVVGLTVDQDGRETTEKRKRRKEPMDVEEGLWRTFEEAAGKVESVRVVRDEVTRVGKGIAYVQFYDANSVESALLLDGKKFPPLLPRALRVTRCKAPHKTLRALDRASKARDAKLASGKPAFRAKSTGYVRKATMTERTGAGRVGKLLGRSAASRLAGSVYQQPSKGRKDGRAAPEAPLKTPEEIVFEGHRASAKDGKPADLKLKRSKVRKSNKTLTGNQRRRAMRAANWSQQRSAQ